MLSHRLWQGVYGADPSVLGSTFVVEGRPFTVVGVAAPGFFGETVRADPPDIWIPLQQEPTIAGDGSLLQQSTSPWLFVIGRLRQDASVAGMAPRLTGILRRWIRYEADYPANLMPDIVRELSNQTIRLVPAGTGIGLAGLSVKEQYGPSLRMAVLTTGGEPNDSALRAPGAFPSSKRAVVPVPW